MEIIHSDAVRSKRVNVWGVPIAPWTMTQTLEEVERLIAAGQASYFMTANLDTAMQASRIPELRAVIRDAAFVLADGMPIVWGAKLRGVRLPGRVPGADLLPALCERAASKEYAVYFLGGPPGVGELAAQKFCQRFPTLRVVGVESPPYRPLSDAENSEILKRIRSAAPQLLILSFGQLKAEPWIHQHHVSLPGTVCINVGAALDFAAGRIQRAPRWMQSTGLEWAYRLSREPRRLVGRYARNAVFASWMIVRDLIAPSRRNDS